MIKNLSVKNFKCFEELSLEMSNLNVFTGINSMGKSTIIQALLLLRQSFDIGLSSKGLQLNGNIANVGIGKDLLYRNSEIDEIEIMITDNAHLFLWKYAYEAESDYLKVSNTNVSDVALNNVNLFSPTFSYVSAERIGPQRFYKKSYHEVFDMNQVGYKGELFADYIAERGLDDKVKNEAVLYKGITNSSLIFQTEAWLSEISPGISLGIKEYTEAGLVSVQYKVGDDLFSPLNVGFGLSYVMPIIVSILKARPGDLVILENPEAHLHPKGQRKMGELIANACAGGVQIIVETHSDHLLNGIRLAVKRGEIDRALIRLNYFYLLLMDKKTIHAKTSPAILDDGSLSDWPDGFFDEWDKAIDELF